MAEIAAENKGNLVKNIRLAGSVLSIILGIWVALQAPPEGLNEKTMIALGITVWLWAGGSPKSCLNLSPA